MRLTSGTILTFEYAGKVRFAKVENAKAKNGRLTITCWDYTADYPTGNYRAFTLSKMKNIKVIA